MHKPINQDGAPSAAETALNKEFEQIAEQAGSTLGVPDVQPKEEPVATVVDAPAPAPAPKETPAPVIETPAPTPAPAEPTPVEKRERPERYIPLAKYHDEQREWKSEKSQLLATIAKTKGFEPGSEEEKTAIDGILAKHDGMTEEGAKELLDFARKSLIPKEMQDGLSKIVDRVSKEEEQEQVSKQQQEEDEYFGNEFTSFTSQHLDTAYPNATDEQKQKMHDLMDELSHTKDYARLDLADIFDIGKVRKQFDVIAGTEAPAPDGGKPAQVVVQARKGPEDSKRGGFPESTLKASDFKKVEGKYDFERLHTLPEGEDKQKLISDLDPEAYVAYVDDLGVRDRGIEVRRGGNTVSLK